MRWWIIVGHIWSVVWRIVEFLIVWAVLATIRDAKTAGIVAVLGLVYATVRTVGIGLFQALLNLSQALDRELRDIKFKMGYEVPPHSDDEIASINKTTAKVWINLISMSAIYFLCLFYAITRLSSS